MAQYDYIEERGNEALVDTRVIASVLNSSETRIYGRITDIMEDKIVEKAEGKETWYENELYVIWKEDENGKYALINQHVFSLFLLRVGFYKYRDNILLITTEFDAVRYGDTQNRKRNDMILRQYLTKAKGEASFNMMDPIWMLHRETSKVMIKHNQTTIKYIKEIFDKAIETGEFQYTMLNKWDTEKADTNKAYWYQYINGYIKHIIEQIMFTREELDDGTRLDRETLTIMQMAIVTEADAKIHTVLQHIEHGTDIKDMVKQWNNIENDISPIIRRSIDKWNKVVAVK